MAIADMYALGLTTAGYHVACFPNPASLLAALEIGMPDLLVLDWNLGKATGGDILEVLRNDARTRGLRVVVLSNLSEKDVAKSSAFRAGVLAWYEKSRTTPAQLAANVEEQLIGVGRLRTGTD